MASLSSATIVYKGMVMPDAPARLLSRTCSDAASARRPWCVFHQRFSTNTLPQWRLAQPFRLLAHNGEINTIEGNRNWAMARAANFRSAKLDDCPSSTRSSR